TSIDVRPFGPCRTSETSRTMETHRPEHPRPSRCQTGGLRVPRGGTGTRWRSGAMASRPHEPEPLLTRGEVASRFRVDPKTVTRWAKAGKLSAIRTLGGHRRYRESEVRALLQGQIPQQRAGD